MLGQKNTSLPSAPFAPAAQPVALRGQKLKVSKPGPSIGAQVCPSSSEKSPPDGPSATSAGVFAPGT